MPLYQQLLIVCPLVFFAGFVDSIAGGGGIISLPAYFAAGLPPHMCLGTNKFAGSCGTGVAAARFIKNKHIHFPAALTAAFFALIGSFAGAWLALQIDGRFLQYLLIALLPALALFVLAGKRFGNREDSKPVRNAVLLSIPAGFFIGAYDGFWGPGAGAFLMLVFHVLLHYDILTASGNTRVVNLASNVAALVTFLLNGQVLFAIGIPAAACGIIGNYLGAGLAIKKGAKAVKPVFVGVLTLLLIKILYDMLTVN